MMALALAALLGTAFGFVASRGGFCLNSGLRTLLSGKTDKTRILLLAIAIQAVTVPLMAASGLTLRLPGFYPVGAIVGGLLFGASMHWASGCAAGVLYKAGEGSARAMVAAPAMAPGAASLELGPLAGCRGAVQSIGSSASSWNFVESAGLDPLWVLPIGGVVGGVLLLRTADAKVGAWSWRATGALVGLLGTVAWPLSVSYSTLVRTATRAREGSSLAGGSP